MNLPVLDGANKAQKNVDYTYKTKFSEKIVNAATMFDINTAIMRCLTKNLAMFGLGHYIYAGEDFPENEVGTKTTQTIKTNTTIPAEPTEELGRCKKCGAENVFNPKTGKIFCKDKCWTK